MTAEKINTILTNGEGLKTEFKLAENDLPNNLFESICAFLNTQGGEIVLGISDDGIVTGVNLDRIETLLK